jgi:hypothetical protein
MMWLHNSHFHDDYGLWRCTSREQTICVNTNSTLSLNIYIYIYILNYLALSKINKSIN